jgi:hypothetical protein
MSRENEIEIVRYVLEQINPRPLIPEVILAAYEVGYDMHSDGITFMHELNFRGLKMKHPLGVGHDLLYAIGNKSPWLPIGCRESNRKARRWADLWFRDGLKDFGHCFRAPVWWFGLRIGAWHGWNCHRRNGNPSPELLRDVRGQWRRARMLE